MNNKILLILTVILIVIFAGAVFFIGNKPNNQMENNISKTEQISKQQEPKKGNFALVTVTNDGFSPSVITVKEGTRVDWVNKSDHTVTVNSALHPTHLIYTPLNLGEFRKGFAVQLLFDKPGKYEYHNDKIPSQTGTVIVEP